MSNKRKELRRKYTVDSNRDHRLPAGREEDESSGDAVATRTSAVPSEEGAERACREKEADDPVQDLLYGHLIETTKYRRDHVKKFTPYRDIHKEPIIIASGLNTVLDAAGIQAPEDVRRRMVNLIHHGLLAGPTRADPAVIQRVSWKLGGAGPFSHRLGQEVAQAVIDEHYKDELTRMPGTRYPVGVYRQLPDEIWTRFVPSRITPSEKHSMTERLAVQLCTSLFHFSIQLTAADRPKLDYCIKHRFFPEQVGLEIAMAKGMMPRL